MTKKNEFAKTLCNYRKMKAFMIELMNECVNE